MAFPNNNLNQTAVYWASPTSDGYGGFTWDTPVEIDCRWIDKTETVLDRTARAGAGEEIISHTQVQACQSLDKQGMLYLGELTDLSEAQKAAPPTVSGAYQIKLFDKIPTMKGNAFFRKAYL